MFIYLARPIDQAHGDTVSWLNEAEQTLLFKLSLAHIGAYLPHRAYMANAGDLSHAWFVHEANSRALSQADALVAFLPQGVPTLGVPAEIEQAIAANKPTLIFTDMRGVQLAAWHDQGAQIEYMDDLDYKMPESDALLVMLRNLRPRLDGIEERDFAPPLLVAGEAANARRGQYSGDAGVDLALASDETLYAGEYRLLPTGVRAAIPDGYFGWITGRSSTWARHRCDVRTAIIDSGYRGELMVGVENRGKSQITFETGTRLGQMIILPAWTGEVRKVGELPEHERGANGYGSSGT